MKDSSNRGYRHRGVIDEFERDKNRTKAGVRAKIERSVGVIKPVFGFKELRRFPRRSPM